MADLVIGLDTFGDVPVDGSGAPVSQAAAIRQVVEEAVLADMIYTAGPQPAGARMRNVELFGEKVMPMVREIVEG
jgi:hypothetical protein